MREGRCVRWWRWKQRRRLGPRVALDRLCEPGSDRSSSGRRRPLLWMRLCVFSVFGVSLTREMYQCFFRSEAVECLC